MNRKATRTRLMDNLVQTNHVLNCSFCKGDTVFRQRHWTRLTRLIPVPKFISDRSRQVPLLCFSGTFLMSVSVLSSPFFVPKMSVKVSELLPFGKELSSRLAVGILRNLLFFV